MSEIKHTPTPWKVFRTKKCTYLGVGDAEGEGIMDAGFGPWRSGAIRDANAEFAVTAVNAYDKHRALIETLTGAARQFMEIFVADGGEPFLTVEDIDHNEMAQRYDALAVALAAAKEISQ